MKIKPVWIAAAALAAAMLCWLVNVDLSCPELAQRTDFLNSCYVSGVLASKGNFAALYPALNATSFTDCDFAHDAHTLMPLLPGTSCPAWQYPPLNAQLYSLFVGMPPSTALLVWQALNVVALAAVVYFMSRTTRKPWPTVASLLVLFLPVFVTMKMGQQGIMLGILPLAVAYFLIHRKRFFAGGLIAGITFLNLKYWLAAGFLAACLARLNWRMAAGLAVGTAVVVGVMLLAAPPAVSQCWLHAVKLAEEYFYDPHLSHNIYLYISAPALLLLAVPPAIRETCKLVVYGIAGLVIFASLFAAFRLCRSSIAQEEKVNLMFAMTMYIMPVVEPHLLYYDLMGIMLANIAIWDLDFKYELQSEIRIALSVSAVAINVYYVCLAVMQQSPFPPAILVILLASHYFRMVKDIFRAARKGYEA